MPTATLPNRLEPSTCYDNLHPVWSRFSDEERRQLLEEDATALKTVASILMAIITAGFVAGAVAVWLMS